MIIIKFLKKILCVILSSPLKFVCWLLGLMVCGLTAAKNFVMEGDMALENSFVYDDLCEDQERVDISEKAQEEADKEAQEEDPKPKKKRRRKKKSYNDGE